MCLTPDKYKGERFVSLGEFPKKKDALIRNCVPKSCSCETTVKRIGRRLGEPGGGENVALQGCGQMGVRECRWKF